MGASDTTLRLVGTDLGEPEENSGRDEGQSGCVFSYKIGLHETKWWSSSGEVRFTVAEHEGTKVKPILIDQAECGKTSRKSRTSHVDLAINVCFEPPGKCFQIVAHQCSVRTNCFKDRVATHFGLERQAAAKLCSISSHSGLSSSQ